VICHTTHFFGATVDSVIFFSVWGEGLTLIYTTSPFDRRLCLSHSSPESEDTDEDDRSLDGVSVYADPVEDEVEIAASMHTKKGTATPSRIVVNVPNQPNESVCSYGLSKSSCTLGILYISNLCPLSTLARSCCFAVRGSRHLRRSAECLFDKALFLTQARRKQHIRYHADQCSRLASDIVDRSIPTGSKGIRDPSVAPLFLSICSTTGFSSSKSCSSSSFTTRATTAAVESALAAVRVLENENRKLPDRRKGGAKPDEEGLCSTVLRRDYFLLWK
jgi:hypothetical protein